MYMFFWAMEKVLSGLGMFLKKVYYKLKYGNRLKIGKGVHFRKGFLINISKNGKVEIGDGTFFNNYCAIHCHNKIRIGKDNLFGENVRIYDHNHVFNDKKVDIKTTYKDGEVTIGNRNWLGSNVLVLSRAHLGNNNVIGGGRGG